MNDNEVSYTYVLKVLLFEIEVMHLNRYFLCLSHATIKCWGIMLSGRPVRACGMMSYTAWGNFINLHFGAFGGKDDLIRC